MFACQKYEFFHTRQMTNHNHLIFPSHCLRTLLYNRNKLNQFFNWKCLRMQLCTSFPFRNSSGTCISLFIHSNASVHSLIVGLTILELTLLQCHDMTSHENVEKFYSISAIVADSLKFLFAPLCIHLDRALRSKYNSIFYIREKWFIFLVVRLSSSH